MAKLYMGGEDLPDDYIDENGDDNLKEINAGIGIIFKQRPEFPKKIKIGKKINLWVVNDSTLINK